MRSSAEQAQATTSIGADAATIAQGTNVVMTTVAGVVAVDDPGDLILGAQTTGYDVRPEVAEQVRSLDLIPVLQGHDRFFDMHLASAGRI